MHDDDEVNRHDNNTKQPGESKAPDDTERLFANQNHSPINERGGSMLPEEFLWDVEHNGFAFDPADFPKADEFKKTPLDGVPQHGWTWAEGWGAKKLVEYCKLVREATHGHWDETGREV